MSNFKAGTPLEVLFAAMGCPSEPVYTFVDDETGQPTHILSGRLAEALKRSGAVPMLVEMGDTLIDAIKAGTLGVEEAHALTLPEAALDVPAIVGAWGEKHIIIDGAHRLWRRWKRGDIDFPAYVVPERAWRLFEIGDVPGDGAFWDDFNRNAKVR